MDLQELIDREQIRDLITTYTRAVDTCRYLDALVCFTDDAVLDYTKVGGPAASATEALTWVGEAMAGFERTQHLVGQVEFRIDGDEATATAYFTNPMVLKDQDGKEKVIDVGGYYHHTLVRTVDGWRSRRMVDDVQWMRGF